MVRSIVLLFALSLSSGFQLSSRRNLSGQILGGARKNDPPTPQVESDQRRYAFGNFLRAAVCTNVLENQMKVGDIVVAKAELPSLNIWADQSYELKSVYWQVSSSDGLVEHIHLDHVQAESLSPHHTQFITLYSPVYHEVPVTVTPQEVGLISLQEEVKDSILVALPILSFWLATSFMFVTQYQTRHGGSLLDAFLGR